MDAKQYKLNAQKRALTIFSNLTEAQKDYLQDLYNDAKYWERQGQPSKAKYYHDRAFIIRDFLLKKESNETRETFYEIIIDYHNDRYNKEQKHIDDILLNK